MIIFEISENHITCHLPYLDNIYKPMKTAVKYERINPFK